MNRQKLNEVMATASQVLSPLGFECIEAEWQAHDRILRLFVDCLPGDRLIDLEGCAKSSRALDEAGVIDALVHGPYTLEVSSPGIERPLRRAEDFRRFLGRKADIRLVDHKLGQPEPVVKSPKKAIGVLQAVDERPNESGFETWVTLATEQGTHQFPLNALRRASLVYDWAD